MILGRPQTPVCAITVAELRGDTSDMPRFQQVVATYAWKGDVFQAEDAPRIYIPGMPKEFKPSNIVLPLKLDPDGVIVCDENRFRLSRVADGRFPMLPLFLAVEHFGFDHTKADVIIDNTTLLKMTGCLKGQLADSLNGPFADLDLINRDTLVVTRLEKNYLKVPQVNKPTFGIAFEHSANSSHPAYADHATYYMVALVNIGDFRMLVRSQVDAVQEGKPNDAISSTEHMWYKVPSSNLEYTLDGSTELWSRTRVEMKTRSTRAKSKDWDSWYAQMLFSGAKVLVLGMHKDGVVKKVLQIPFEDVQQHAITSMQHMHLIKPLLQKLKSAAVDHGHLRAHFSGSGGAEFVLSLVADDGPCRMPPSGFPSQLQVSP